VESEASKRIEEWRLQVSSYYEKDESLLACDLADIKEPQLLGEYAT
jgi:hypothetical protein